MFVTALPILPSIKITMKTSTFDKFNVGIQLLFAGLISYLRLTEFWKEDYSPPEDYAVNAISGNLPKGEMYWRNPQTHQLFKWENAKWIKAKNLSVNDWERIAGLGEQKEPVSVVYSGPVKAH